MAVVQKPLQITLITQEDCTFCEQAQEILRRYATEYPLAVTTLDIATPEGEEIALKGGVLFPPGLFIEGQFFSYGRLSERKLRKELTRRFGQQ